ncbi:MAG TPA: 4'-phosphopantetheinyl transferase superfamily protein [Polyangiaceae bacterium]|nr:4'-phosphopantetheinyl transferase superfamily protein [Polyangiaceae bacterium]
MDLRWITPPPIFGDGLCVRMTADLELEPDVGARERRQREFAVGRRCAAQALIDAGSTEVHVGIGSFRAPVWPAGFVGSITHCRSRAAAAVGSISRLRSVGIDCEPLFDDEAMREAAPLVLSTVERRLPAFLAPNDLATVVFSAKESLFKCLYPLVEVFFEFGDAEAEAIAPDGALRLRLLRDLGGGFAPGSAFEARFSIHDGHAHTVLELRR